jgi:hypothetical protein
MRAFDIASVSQGIVSQDTVSRHTVSQRAWWRLREAHGTVASLTWIVGLAATRQLTGGWASPAACPRDPGDAAMPVEVSENGTPAGAIHSRVPTGTRASRRSPTLWKALAILGDGELSSATAVSQAAMPAAPPVHGGSARTAGS